MRQTYTVGTQPDVHTSSAVPAAGDLVTPQTDRQNQEEGFVQHNVRYKSVSIHGSLEDYRLGSQTNLMCCEELGETRSIRVLCADVPSVTASINSLHE